MRESETEDESKSKLIPSYKNGLEDQLAPHGVSTLYLPVPFLCFLCFVFFLFFFLLN